MMEKTLIAALIVGVVGLSIALIDARHELRKEEIKSEMNNNRSAFALWADGRKADVANGLDVYALEVEGVEVYGGAR